MGWWNRIRNAVAPGRVSSDIDRELAFHVEELTERLIASGLSPEDAAREAERRLGHRPTTRERTRDVDIALWLESLLADLRYAFRSLRNAPGFALVAVLSLALGIGANTAIFSLLDSVLLRSLPVSQPEQLVKLDMGTPRNDVFTNPLWEAIRDRDQTFNGLFAFGSDRFNLASSGPARMAYGHLVSGSFFSTLAVQPALGRLIQPADDQRGCAGVVVLSHGFWQREYAGARDAVGRVLTINRQPLTIIGVAPARFSGVEVGRSPEFYVPICSEPQLSGIPESLDQRTRWWIQIMGRLPEGVTLPQATARLAAMAHDIFAATLPPDWDQSNQHDYLQRTLSLTPAPSGVSDVRFLYRTALILLMALVGVVLLIACANVANLLLARAATRRREIAMRLAIGASRARIIRQALTESLVLSVLGALVGLLFARWSSQLLAGLIGNGRVPVSLDLPLDLRLFGFSLLLAVITALLFGVVPAWRSVRLDVQEVLKNGAGGQTVAGRSLAAGRALVIGQVAFSLVLVAVAGLLVGSFRALAAANPGFRRDGIVLAAVDWTTSGIEGPARETAARAMLEQLRARPGVDAASASVITPVSGRAWNSFVNLPGYQPTSRFDNLVWFNGISEGFFTTLGTPLLAGRDIRATDRASSPRVAVVNRAFVKHFFGDRNPIGTQVTVEGGRDEVQTIEIVGVAGDAKYRSLRDSLDPIVYVPWSQNDYFTQLIFLTRSSRPTAATVAEVVAAAQATMPNASLQLSTLAGQLHQSLARERLLALLSGFFGGLALLLALIGLYGIMAYNVTRRRREIGIRVALGATRVRLVRMVTGEAGRLILAGLVLGGLGILAASRLVRSFLYERTPLDPTTMAIAFGLVALVALAAGALPALRAVRQDPQAVLREE